MALKDIFKGLDNKKVKMFSFFLVFSFLSWTVTKLSQSYDSWVTVELRPVNTSDSLFVNASEIPKAKIRLKASGFKLMAMGVSESRLKVDVSRVSFQGNTYFLTKERVMRQLQERLSGSAEVLNMDADTVYFDLFKVRNKKVVVRPLLDLQLETNYVLKGKLKVEPDSVEIKGPSEVIDTVYYVETVPKELHEMTDAFEVEIPLKKLNSANNTEISEKKITLSGDVVRFSEKVFELPVKVLNVPENYTVRLFPKTVSILCKAGEEDLEGISLTDFEVVAQIDSSAQNPKELNLQLAKQPENAISVRLLKDSVEFLLEPK